MPTKRKRLVNRQVGIPAAALEAWCIGDLHGLHRALGIKPWQESPFYADVPEPPSWMRPDEVRIREDWVRALALRCRLIEMAGEPGGVGRHGEPLGPGKPNWRWGQIDGD
jgi:hypothetical protein